MDREEHLILITTKAVIRIRAPKAKFIDGRRVALLPMQLPSSHVWRCHLHVVLGLCKVVIKAQRRRPNSSIDGARPVDHAFGPQSHLAASFGTFECIV